MPLRLNKTIPSEDEQLASAVVELRKKVTDLALETGLHGLPQEKAIKVLDAELEAAALKLFGLPPQNYDEPLQARHDEQQKLQEELRANQPLAKPDWPALAPKAIRWRLATMNVVLVAALIGVVLTAMGAALGWLALAGLSLSAALVLVNLPLIPSLVRRLSNWTAHRFQQLRRYFALRRLQKRIRRIERESKALQQQKETQMLRQRRGAEWKKHTREILVQHFHYHLERAEHAARLIAEEKQKQSTGTTQVKEIHLNGIPKHDDQTTVPVSTTNEKEKL